MWFSVRLLRRSALEFHARCCRCSPHCCNLHCVGRVTAYLAAPKIMSSITCPIFHADMVLPTNQRSYKNFRSTPPFSKQKWGKRNALSSSDWPLTGSRVFCRQAKPNSWKKRAKVQTSQGKNTSRKLGFLFHAPTAKWHLQKFFF